jgi:hypothetical protein
MKGEMKAIDTAVWTNVVAKRVYTVGIGSRGQAIVDPDVTFYESSPATPAAMSTAIATRRWKTCGLISDWPDRGSSVTDAAHGA